MRDKFSLYSRTTLRLPLMLPASRRKVHGATATLCLGAVLAVGCGSGARLDKQIDEMRQELIRVQNDNDRLEERLAAVEAHQVALAEGARSTSGGRSQHPPLKVLQLVPPSEQGVNEDADANERPLVNDSATPAPGAKATADNAPRPVIRGTGQKVYSTASPSSSAHEPGQAQPNSGGK